MIMELPAKPRQVEPYLPTALLHGGWGWRPQVRRQDGRTRTGAYRTTQEIALKVAEQLAKDWAREDENARNRK